MRLLVDTQIFLWCLHDPRKLPKPARDAITAADNAVLVSAAVVWEIAIKASLGRLDMTAATVAHLPQSIGEAGFDELPVSARHAIAVYGLPWHHRDPFDRLLVAQARTESLTLVSVDPAMRGYDVPLLP